MENQLMDYLLIVFVLVVTTCQILCFIHLKKLRSSNRALQAYVEDQSKLISQKQSKITELQNDLAKQRAQKNSRELDEFLSDIKTHGYGVVRIDPDNVFYRGR
jgi:glucan biosynthesis protein